MFEELTVSSPGRAEMVAGAKPLPRWARGLAAVSSVLPFLLSLAGLLCLWLVIEGAGLVPGYMLPSPSEVGRAFVDHLPVLMTDARVTAVNAGFGLGLALLAAVAVGVVAVHSNALRNVIMPLIVGMEAMPKIAFAPMLVLWVGIGSSSKILVAAMIAFFPIVVNVMRGLQDVDPHILAVSRVLRAPAWKVLLYIRFPNSLIPLFDGLRIAVPGSIIGAILGEFIASNEGLGHRLLVSNAALRLDLAFAALFLVALLSIGGFQVVNFLERRLIIWRRE